MGMFLLHGLLDPSAKDCAGGQLRDVALGDQCPSDSGTTLLTVAAVLVSHLPFTQQMSTGGHIANGFSMEPALFLSVRLSKHSSN